jgi:hypothetical protein
LTGLETISRPPLPGFAAIERLADATGIMQHSRYSIPDPDHGYCVDDNARALILMHRRLDLPDAIHDRWAKVFANFVERAWNPSRGGFRNFMNHEGVWLEETGSEDSQGRSLWSLGITAAEARSSEMRRWALDLFEEAAEPLRALGWPRAMAFCLLGAAGILGKEPGHAGARAMIEDFAPRLSGLVSAHARPGWTWFEPGLAYDNARLSEALLRAGLATGNADFIDVGLKTLRWITAMQTTPEGHFRPVGHKGFGRAYAPPARYDQQPLEAQATIEACEAAFAASRAPLWLDEAERAFGWFLGLNDGGVALGDPGSGECYDGLTPTGANLNRGAESVLAFQLGACAIARLRAGA